MSFLHIIGFSIKPKIQMKFRMKWYPKFPDSMLEIEPNDSIILNLIEIHQVKLIEELRRVVDFLGQNGGNLFVIAAPIKLLSRDVSNYHF